MGTGRLCHYRVSQFRFVHGLHGSHNDGKMLGFTSGHHAVDGHFLNGGNAPAGFHLKKDFMPFPFGARKHFFNRCIRHRHNGKPVSPPFVDEGAIQLIKGVEKVGPFNNNPFSHQILFFRFGSIVLYTGQQFRKLG